MPAIELPIKAIFTDIGGVLLTNGWGQASRQRAAEAFHLDYGEMNERHHLTFDTYEVGKLSLDEYLNRTIFNELRTFSPDDFKAFMFSVSKPYPDMIGLIQELKSLYNLRIAAVSNEGRELTVDRINTFKLDEFIDFFISSSFVHFRKPDAEIYRLALDISQVSVDQVLYIDDRALFVEVARGLGFRSIHHTSYETTKASLAEFGLAIPETQVTNS
jgi:putative hydrolase of the HAD superfamily